MANKKNDCNITSVMCGRTCYSDSLVLKDEQVNNRVLRSGQKLIITTTTTTTTIIIIIIMTDFTLFSFLCQEVSY